MRYFWSIQVVNYYYSIAVRLDMNFYTPSSLLCINDIIIPYHLLKFCLQSYISSYAGDEDPFLHPILMNSSVIKNLPYTRIFGGSSDPMRDEFIRFTNLLTYSFN